MELNPTCSGLHVPAVSHKKNFPESHVITPLLTKLVWSRWLDIGLIVFCEFPSQSINTQKRTRPISSHLDLTLGQCPGVNNPYKSPSDKSGKYVYNLYGFHKLFTRRLINIALDIPQDFL